MRNATEDSRPWVWHSERPWRCGVESTAREKGGGRLRGRPPQPTRFWRSCLRLAAVARVHANPCATSDPEPCARDHTTTMFATTTQRRKAEAPLRPKLRGGKAAQPRFSKKSAA